MEVISWRIQKVLYCVLNFAARYSFCLFLSFSAYLEYEWMAGDLTALLDFKMTMWKSHTKENREKWCTEPGSLLIMEFSHKLQPSHLRILLHEREINTSLSC